jgi:hypothetical protein
MIGQGNVTHLLVGKDLDTLANTGKRSDLAVGQIGVFLVGSQTALGANALTAGQRFTIATKNSKGVIVETPVMEYDNIKSKSFTGYAAPAERVRAIGFNGVSGAIDPINYANYVAHIFWKDNSKTFGQGIPVKFAAYAADGSATQAEIAAGLVNNFNKNFQREKPKLIKAEVLLNSAGTIVPTGAGTVSFTNGSKYVKFNTAIDDATGAAKLAVGDYIKAATGASAVAYKIVAIDVATDIATLDTPYQGATATIANATAKIVLAATAATADAGVKLTGMPLTEGFEPGVIRWDFIDFEIQLGSEVGSTTQSVITNPTLGAGSYYEVAQNEWFLKGNRGEAWRVGNYPKNVTLEATAGKNYEQFTVNYATTNAQTIDRTVNSYGSVIIAVESASAGNIVASLKTILGVS